MFAWVKGAREGAPQLAGDVGAPVRIATSASGSQRPSRDLRAEERLIEHRSKTANTEWGAKEREKENA
jgi:hypothetical protein